jgi:hypothetical protein
MYTRKNRSHIAMPKTKIKIGEREYRTGNRPKVGDCPCATRGEEKGCEHPRHPDPRNRLMILQHRKSRKSDMAMLRVPSSRLLTASAALPVLSF